MGPEKRPLQTNPYDEASSGSDDESSGSSSSEDEGSVKVAIEANEQATTRTRKDASDSSDDAPSDSSDSENDSDPSDSDDGNIQAEDGDQRHDDNDDDNSSSGSISSSDEAEDNASDQDMPLYERIRKKEEQGVNMRSARQRKSEALQLASQRLASYKEEKRRAAAAKDNENSDSKAPLKKKKKSKHRPTEVSSKRADYFRRGAPKLNESGVGVEIGAKRYKPQDPRVSSLSGHFNEEQFQKNYSFLEEMRNQEIGQVRKRITAYKATGEKGRRMRRKLGLDGTLEEEEARLKSLTQQRADIERRKIDRTAQQTVKRKIRDEVESGQRGAYFLKRKEKKRLEMEEKLKEIQKRKGNKAVEKILAKKRRKNKSRDASIFAK